MEAALSARPETSPVHQPAQLSAPRGASATYAISFAGGTSRQRGRARPGGDVSSKARRVGGQLHWLPRARALPQPVSQGRRARLALGASGSATLLLLAPHRLYERERHFVGLARQRRAYGFKARHTRLESPLGPAARRLLGLLA